MAEEDRIKELEDKIDALTKQFDSVIKEKDSIIKELKQTVFDQFIEIEALKELHKILEKEANAEKIAQLRALLKKQYEAASEQLYLFNDIETTAENGALEETPTESPVEVQSYVRKKARSSVSLPADTPVVDVYDDSVIDKCSRCGSEMQQVGEKVYEAFSRIERTVVIRKHVKQFSCPKCEPENKEEGRIIETPVTANILDGTVCDPTLLAQIIENKFSYALPLYRQALSFKDIGLSRFTMSAWLTKVGQRLVDNMAPCLEKLIYTYPLVNMDETPVKVLGLKDDNGNKKAPNSKANAFMVVRAATDENGRQGPVMFSFSDNRRDQTLKNLLYGYKGVLQTDGLYGYSNAEKECSFTHIDCLVHARRKAISACDKKTSGTAYELVKLYASFFHEEGIVKDEFDSGHFTADEYVCKRREILEPILNEIKKFCEKNAENSIGTLRTALNYPLERWNKLIKFLDYPFATSSNQRAENAIRPFCVGRRNWLFCITELGAEVSAFFYSLVESCKSMGINVQDYLTYLFMNSNTIKDGDEEGWTRMLPGNCDISSARAYRELLFTAKPDPTRTEPYNLRGKRV